MYSFNIALTLLYKYIMSVTKPAVNSNQSQICCQPYKTLGKEIFELKTKSTER